MPEIGTHLDTSTELASLAKNFDHDDNSRALVFFDLETSALQLMCDILEIAMQNKSAIFNEYIKPNASISPAASKVNGFTNEGHDLYLHGRNVSAKLLRIVANASLQFFTGLEKPCVLVAHNCAFDAPRRMRLINQVNLVAEFSKDTEGFVDTLPLFRNKFPREDCGLIKLAARKFVLQPEQPEMKFSSIRMSIPSTPKYTKESPKGHPKRYCSQPN